MNIFGGYEDFVDVFRGSSQNWMDVFGGSSQNCTSLGVISMHLRIFP